MTTEQLRRMNPLYQPKRRSPLPKAPVNGWEIPANPKRDQALDRLATELGFQTKNILVRVLANEISHCPKSAFFKAIGQFSQFTRKP